MIKKKIYQIGWLRGRITNFEKYFEKYNNAINKADKYHFINLNKDINDKIIPRILKNRRKSKDQNKNIQKYLLSKFDTKEEKIKLLKKYFEEYKINGHKGVKEKFNYPYSRVALYNAFKKYLTKELKEFINI